jgi:Ca2+-binding RTX toxin-like protein
MKKQVMFLLTTLMVLSGSEYALAGEPTNPECTITGDQNSQTLFGTPEDDVICGMGGNDIIYALEGDDIILGGNGDDFIDGGAGDDDIWGGSGSDNLYGQSGKDDLYGGLNNDGLIGGSGTDLLRGEGGVDTCVDFTKDNYIKSDCFYDRSLPTIQSISFGKNNPRVDATKGGQTLDLLVSASDTGAGLYEFSISFGLTSKLREGMSYASGLFRGESIKCQTIIEENLVHLELDDAPQKPVTNCLLSGTPNKGVYKVAVELPRTMPKGNYSIQGIRYEDKAQNARSLEWDDVAKLNLKLGFTQTGTPDRSAPKLLGGVIVGSKVVRNASEKIVARISFKDEGGNAIKRFGMYYDVPESGYERDPGFEQWVSPRRQIVRCDAVEQVWDPCIYSGTASNGVLQFYLDVDPAWHDLKFLWKAQKLVPKEYYIVDALENQYGGAISPTIAKALTYYKGFSGKAPVDDKDFKAPTLIDFVVDKTKIDTGSSSQTVTVKVTLKDDGAGLNLYNANVYLEFAMDSGPAVSCSAFGNASGTTKQATYTFKCVLGANFAAGKYGFHLNAGDMSLRANTLFLEPSQIRSSGKTVYVTNG